MCLATNSGGVLHPKVIVMPWIPCKCQHMLCDQNPRCKISVILLTMVASSIYFGITVVCLENLLNSVQVLYDSTSLGCHLTLKFKRPLFSFPIRKQTLSSLRADVAGSCSYLQFPLSWMILLFPSKKLSNQF